MRHRLLPLTVIVSALLLNACGSTPSKSLQATPEPGKRSLSEFVDDEKIASQAYRKITKSPVDFSETHVRVDSFKGILLLTGQVPDEELKAEAGRLAQSVEGVRNIHNEIQIQTNTNAFARTNDSGLEAKIRVKLLADREVEGSKIKIVVEDRVVYLMGMLTRKQTKLATDIVANVAGIDRVVRVVEYID